MWNGLIVGGVDGYYATDDVYVYYGGAASPGINQGTELRFQSLPAPP